MFKAILDTSGAEYAVPNPGAYTIFPSLGGGSASIEIKQQGMDSFHPVENGEFTTDGAVTIELPSNAIIKPTLTGGAILTITR